MNCGHPENGVANGSKLRILAHVIGAEGHAMPDDRQISFGGVHRFLTAMFAGSVHAKRILSLAGAVTGAIESSSLAVALIGEGLALARGLLPKHAIKQVDRMLSNERIVVSALFAQWVPYVLGKRPSVTLAAPDTVREMVKTTCNTSPDVATTLLPSEPVFASVLVAKLVAWPTPVSDAAAPVAKPLELSKASAKRVCESKHRVTPVPPHGHEGAVVALAFWYKTRAIASAA